MAKTDIKILVPRRQAHRPTERVNEIYNKELRDFAADILRINKERGEYQHIKVSSRGWCYLLEEHGLLKGDFDLAQETINICRKKRFLPPDFCSEDEGRGADNVEDIDDEDPLAYAQWIVEYIDTAHDNYTPISAWENQDFYIQMLVEKIDLKSLFTDICKEHGSIEIRNGSGWTDINSRLRMMRNYKYWEKRGKRLVLIYCGDFDPIGLKISEVLLRNFDDLAEAAQWTPDNLIIDRFGLNEDFIKRHKLSWIDNLATGNKKKDALPFDDPRHGHHFHEHIQSYLKKYGPRKVEANALVTRPRAGRELCRRAILKYFDMDAFADYELEIARKRDEVEAHIKRLIGKRKS